jgi:hypothetical protein
MNSISALSGQPRPLSVGGQTYQLYPLTLEDLGQLQGWVDSHFPDPFATVQAAIANGNFNVTQQQFLLKLAVDASVRPRNLIGTPAADQLLQSVEGIKRLLVLSIRKGRPDFSDDDAAQLCQQLGLGDVQAAFAVTGVSAVMADPKEPRTTPRPSGSSTSRRRRKR